MLKTFIEYYSSYHLPRISKTLMEIIEGYISYRIMYRVMNGDILLKDVDIDSDEIYRRSLGYFGIREGLLRSRSRDGRLVMARDFISKALKDFTGLSFREIGGYVGRDRSTVSINIKKLNEQLIIDKKLRERYQIYAYRAGIIREAAVSVSLSQ